MVMTHGQVEAWLKEILVQIHKELTGRGPKDTYVRLFKRTVVFHLEDTFTPLENRLLDVAWGEDEIRQLRGQIFKSTLPILKHKIKDKLACEVLEAATIVLPGQHSQFGLLVLDQDLEKTLSDSIR